MSTSKKTTVVDGISTTYYQSGQGPNLLFLHGGRLRAQTFRKSLSDLSKRYTVIAPDIPGYGDSATPKEIWSFIDYARFFDNFLHALKLTGVTVVGYSMGGGIALILSARSSRVNRLVLVDAAGLNSKAHKPKFRTIRRLQFYFAHPRYYGTILRLIGEYLRFSWRHRADQSHMQQIRHACAATDYQVPLQAITVPTTLLWGQHDIHTPLTTALQLMPTIPHATLHTVNANHDWPLYKPLLFSHLVL